MHIIGALPLKINGARMGFGARLCKIIAFMPAYKKNFTQALNRMRISKNCKDYKNKKIELQIL